MFYVWLVSLGKHSRVSRLLHRPKFDLKKRLKEIMVSPNVGVACMSENPDLFQRVMQEFCHYEVTVSYFVCLKSKGGL